MPQLFKHHQPFTLESGKTLPALHLAYTTYGTLNPQGDNVIWIFHALTANSQPAEWWNGLVGEGFLFDPQHHFIICVNMPGSCYGSISPLDRKNDTGEKWYHDFPLFTTRDMIRSYELLRAHLGIKKIYLGIGGSMGGQQLLEWAIEHPELFQNIIPIATNAQHSPWGIAFNATQRLCIEQDETWRNKADDAGINGMKTARALALLSYRNYAAYNKTQTGFAADTAELTVDQKVFRAETYQRYQGEKLAKRFNAFSYYFLSRGMDTHDVSRNRGSLAEALEKITARTLVIAIQSDLLFPVEESEIIARHVRGAQLSVIDSPYGHDGFLLEFEQITQIIRAFLRNDAKGMGF